MTESVRGQGADHRGTRTGTVLPAPEQFCFYANVEIQLISAFFKAIQLTQTSSKKKLPAQLASVTNNKKLTTETKQPHALRACNL
jgi:hypothetical protein